jgi:hypothetical protein
MSVAFLIVKNHSNVPMLTERGFPARARSKEGDT